LGEFFADGKKKERIGANGMVEKKVNKIFGFSVDILLQYKLHK